LVHLLIDRRYVDPHGFLAVDEIAAVSEQDGFAEPVVAFGPKFRHQGSDAQPAEPNMWRPLPAAEIRRPLLAAGRRFSATLPAAKHSTVFAHIHVDISFSVCGTSMQDQVRRADKVTTQRDRRSGPAEFGDELGEKGCDAGEKLLAVGAALGAPQLAPVADNGFTGMAGTIGPNVRAVIGHGDAQAG
jgi:hypothetical protein